MNAFSSFPRAVDFIDEACRSDRDRGHANNEPKHQRTPPEFGVGDNPDSKGEYACRDQICSELFHVSSDPMIFAATHAVWRRTRWFRVAQTKLVSLGGEPAS
jgi:hypothetical protein